MDVCGIFLGDSNMTFSSMRGTVYRDYEQFPYGTLENTKSSPFKDSYSKVKEKCEMVKIQKNGKQSCPFCKEHKKRPLISYLRRRDMQKNNEKICEESEEEEEEQKCTGAKGYNYIHQQIKQELQKVHQNQIDNIKSNRNNSLKTN